MTITVTPSSKSKSRSTSTLDINPLLTQAGSLAVGKSPQLIQLALRIFIAPIIALAGLWLLVSGSTGTLDIMASAVAVAALLFVPTFMIATIHFTAQILEGQDGHVGAGARKGFDKLVPATSAFFIISVMVAVGTNFFIYPGALCLALFCLTLPIIALEDKSAMAAMKESSDLSENRRLPLFAAFAVPTLLWQAGAIFLVTQVILPTTVTAKNMEMVLAAVVVMALFQFICVVYNAVLLAVVYDKISGRSLRRRLKAREERLAREKAENDEK